MPNTAKGKFSQSSFFPPRSFAAPHLWFFVSYGCCFHSCPRLICSRPGASEHEAASLPGLTCSSHTCGSFLVHKCAHYLPFVLRNTNGLKGLFLKANALVLPMKAYLLNLFSVFCFLVLLLKKRVQLRTKDKLFSTSFSPFSICPLVHTKLPRHMPI